MAIKLFLVALLIAHLVYADIYMHNPRGSNNRNCERNVSKKKNIIDKHLGES